MPYSLIIQSIQKLMNCSDQELKAFESKLTSKPPVLFKRKEFLLQEGQVCRHLYFVNKGCIRYFHVKEGEEHTGQFFFEKAWYTDMGSFLSEEPSDQNIQAIESSEILLIPKTVLYQLYDEYPTFERLGRLLIEQAFLGLRRHNHLLMNLTPEEHYLMLIKERPKVMERVSLQYIASYLGIKPESLSRIRKRLFEQK